GAHSKQVIVRTRRLRWIMQCLRDVQELEQISHSRCSGIPRGAAFLDGKAASASAASGRPMGNLLYVLRDHLQAGLFFGLSERAKQKRQSESPCRVVSGLRLF